MFIKIISQNFSSSYSVHTCTVAIVMVSPKKIITNSPLNSHTYIYSTAYILLCTMVAVDLASGGSKDW